MSIWVSDITPWNSWCAADYCKICNFGPFSTTFEFSYKKNGDEVETYISEACIDCTSNLVMQDKDYTSFSFWKKCEEQGKNTYLIFKKYELLDDSFIERYEEYKKSGAY